MTFGHCHNLKTVNFAPNSVLSSVRESAFYNCYSLDSIVLPASVRTIQSEVFKNCRGLKSVTFPETIEGFSEEGLFKGCWQLQSVVLPKGITDIGKNTFQDCWSLTSVSLPEGVKWISRDAFKKCSKLKTVNFPSSLSAIYEEAFFQCESLDSIDLSMVYSLYDEAFAYCSNLKVVVLPNVADWTGFGRVSAGMFKNCTGLKRVYNLQRTPNDIKPDIFEGVNQSECELYVPFKSVEIYKMAPVWNKFIVKGSDMSGIDDVPADRPAITPVARYNLQGSRLSGPQQGINIVRYSDGTTKKELVE